MFERTLMTNIAGKKSSKIETDPSYSSPILANDGGVDWLGEVSSNELITGDALASLINLTAGTSQHSDAGWLHVGLNGSELLIAKKPFRHSLSWNDINAVNAVYGNRILSINGQDYKIRLPKGVNSDPTVEASGYDVAHSHGSEWNRIFYRLTENAYLQTGNTKVFEESFVHLVEYSKADLILDYRTGDGSYSWCQETAGTSRVLRGNFGVSYLDRNPPTLAFSRTGWRPILERV